MLGDCQTSVNRVLSIDEFVLKHDKNVKNAFKTGENSLSAWDLDPAPDPVEVEPIVGPDQSDAEPDYCAPVARPKRNIRIPARFKDD